MKSDQYQGARVVKMRPYSRWISPSVDLASSWLRMQFRVSSEKSTWMLSQISQNFSEEMKPVGASEVNADCRFRPDFPSTSFNSVRACSSTGRQYSPTKALRIDLAMLRSTSLSSWQQTLSLVQSSTMQRASNKACSWRMSKGQACSFSLISLRVAYWLRHFRSRRGRLPSSARLSSSLTSSTASPQNMNRQTNSFLRLSICDGLTGRTLTAPSLCFRCDFLGTRSSTPSSSCEFLRREPGTDSTSSSESEAIWMILRFSVLPCLGESHSLKPLSMSVFTRLRVVRLSPSIEISVFSRFCRNWEECSLKEFFLERLVGMSSVLSGSSPVLMQEIMVDRQQTSCFSLSISPSFYRRQPAKMLFSASNRTLSLSLSSSTVDW